MKSIFSSFVCLILLLNLSAQQNTPHFTLKFNNGSTYNFNPAGAMIQKDSAIHLIGEFKNSFTHLFQIEFIPTDKVKKKFSKGTYYFNTMEQLMDYTPGVSIGYQLKAVFIQKNSQGTTQEWKTAINPERGYIVIEEITDNRLKGRFSFDIIQNIPNSKNQQTVEGSFNVSFFDNKNSQNEQTANKLPPAKEETVTKNVEPIEKKEKGLIGLYDIQLGFGVVYKNKLGFDADLGATLVNLAYSKNTSATIEIHYEYLSYKFKKIDLNTQRTNIYTRIRPFTINPNKGESDAENILGVFFEGLYVDLGLSNGKHHYLGTLVNPEDTHFTSSGLFWGWGWNLIWRPEDKRMGASLGLGSKWYELEMPNGTKSKYKNRVFSFGFVYNLAKQ